MCFHLAPIIGNQEKVILNLAFELDRDQECADTTIRIFLSHSNEILGDTLKKKCGLLNFKWLSGRKGTAGL